MLKMPWKLILLVIVIVLVAIFVGVNHANVCNISFIFTEFHNVPVYVTILVSFVIGMLIMLPFTIGKKRGKSADRRKNVDVPAVSVEEYPAENARNRRNRRRQEAAARKAEKARKKEKNAPAEVAPVAETVPAAVAAEPAQSAAETPATDDADKTK